LSPPSEETAKNKVTLCTIHAAKGLEWDRVYFPCFVDGIVPLLNGETTPEQINEERCAAYVAITRAKTQCQIYAPQCINLNNGQGYRHYTESRFIRESGITIPTWRETSKHGFGRQSMGQEWK